MKLVVSMILVTVLAGCSLNSAYEANRACSDMKKPCHCDGMKECGKNADGSTCCTPDDCACEQISTK